MAKRQAATSLTYIGPGHIFSDPQTGLVWEAGQTLEVPDEHVERLMTEPYTEFKSPAQPDAVDSEIAASGDSDSISKGE